MRRTWMLLLLSIITLKSIGQIVVSQKGTKYYIDSSKWKISGNDIYNKNIGKIGIGTDNPTAALHTKGSIRFEELGTNTVNTKVLTADAAGNITSQFISNLLMNIADVSVFPILNQNTTGNAATVTTNANLTGPVTSVGNATAIAANVVNNGMLSQIASQVFKGRNAAGTGDVEDLTATQATAMLNTFTATLNGVVPASGGGTTNFLRADGVFAAPTENFNRTVVTLTADVTNKNATSNTLQDVIGLSFNVSAGKFYRFYALIPYTSEQTNNGSRWTINGPASSFISYVSRYTDNPEVVNYGSAFNLPNNCSANSSLTANIAIIQGVIRPSSNGTVQIRFASENSNRAIVAKAGATLEYW